MSTDTPHICAPWCKGAGDPDWHQPPSEKEDNSLTPEAIKRMEKLDEELDEGKLPF